ncbi:MAG: efflux transporter outer membrane subunit [Planctomycetota bacterium]
MRVHLVIRTASVLALCVLGACKVGPDYTPPEIPMPDAWTQELKTGVFQGPTELAQWWEKFQDPVLNELIDRADKGNLDLAIALARIKQARAALGISKGEFLPAVDATGSAEYIDPSNNGLGGALAGNGSDLWSLGFDATWELDVFGRIARNVESSAAGLGAQYEAYRDVRVVLFAEVAANYMTMRAFQQRLAFANDNVKSQEESLKLAESRFEAGVSPELDVAQAKSNLGDTRSIIPALEQGRVAALLRIAVLLGAHPGEVTEMLGEVLKVPTPPEQVGVGVPADMIRQRPDIRAAERQLAASTAQIGVATADLYPRFALNGFFALESTSLSNLFSSDSVTWGIGVPIRWSLFAGGRIKSNIALQEARTEEALKLYERTVLLAIEEIEGSINRYEQEQQRRDALEFAVEAAQRSVTLSTDLYRQGLVDFQRVLDAQRSLFQFQDSAAQSRGFVSNNLVSLYKALGGGWETRPEEAAKEAAGEEKKPADPAKSS